MGGFIVFSSTKNYIELNDVPFSITKNEHANGLMNINHPSFMVFLYKDAVFPNFWMKNTPMPLDIIFCNSEYNINCIKYGKPFDKKIITPKLLTKAVIEAPLGFCKKNNIEIGDRIKIKYDKSILERILNNWS